mmetsp:Transcript_46283/g.83426  ORF Transcript_46283/g.83426 Transcript_46283/m.83426 type:complete len:193 (+) Transcript_46283:45-623(+)
MARSAQNQAPVNPALDRPLGKIPPGYLKSLCPDSTCSSFASSYTATGMLNLTGASDVGTRLAGIKHGAPMSRLETVKELSASQAHRPIELRVSTALGASHLAEKAVHGKWPGATRGAYMEQHRLPRLSSNLVAPDAGLAPPWQPMPAGRAAGRPSFPSQLPGVRASSAPARPLARELAGRANQRIPSKEGRR